MEWYRWCTPMVADDKIKKRKDSTQGWKNLR